MNDFVLPETVKAYLSEHRINIGAITAVEGGTSDKLTVHTCHGGEVTVHHIPREGGCWYCSLPPEHRGCPVHRDGDG